MSTGSNLVVGGGVVAILLFLLGGSGNGKGWGWGSGSGGGGGNPDITLNFLVNSDGIFLILDPTKPTTQDKLSKTTVQNAIAACKSVSAAAFITIAGDVTVAESDNIKNQFKVSGVQTSYREA